MQEVGLSINVVFNKWTDSSIDDLQLVVFCTKILAINSGTYPKCLITTSK
jgi:hypothetical protein